MVDKLIKGKIYWVKLKNQSCGLVVKINGFGNNYAGEQIAECTLLEDRRRGSILPIGATGHLTINDIEKRKQIPDSKAVLYYLDSDLC